MPQIDIGLVFSILKWFAYGAILVYVFAAIGLTMLSARLGMRGGWMAWVPILNLYLLCRMARSSAAWILPALIPVIGLAALSYLGGRVASRLRRPVIVGVMFGMPFIGALLPIALALGSDELPDGAADSEPTKRPIVAGAMSIAVVTAVAILVALGFWTTGRLTQAKAQSGKMVAASLPAHTASTLTEFPIDTATANPVRPTNVITQSFAKPLPGTRATEQPLQAVKIAAKQLPPWMPPASLPAAAESVAAADYVSADASLQPVSVVTLMMRPDQSGTHASSSSEAFLAPPSSATLAKSEPGARATGIEVKNSDGDVYRGYRVSGGESTHYAVNKVGTDIVIVISASDTAGAVTADRLARNLGVGDGLLDDSDYAGAFGELPPAIGDAAWEDIQTYTEADIEKMVRTVEQETARMSAEDRNGEMAPFLPLIKQIRTIAPNRVGIGTHVIGPQGYAAAIASYSNSRSAWLAFSVLDMAKKIVPIPADAGIVIRAVTIGAASGYFVSQSDAGFGYVLRNGNTIVGLAAGKGMNEAALTRWAESYLAKK
jgi:hypothetical protein